MFKNSVPHHLSQQIDIDIDKLFVVPVPYDPGKHIDDGDSSAWPRPLQVNTQLIIKSKIKTITKNYY